MCYFSHLVPVVMGYIAFSKWLTKLGWWILKKKWIKYKTNELKFLDSFYLCVGLVHIQRYLKSVSNKSNVILNILN